MAMDFSNAQLPRLLPLEASFTENGVEADLKRLFVDLFDSCLAAASFDVNVLGAAHLGSFDLVRRSVNTDGLVLLQGDREEAATRYLYRAWKSGDVQGRGLHFLCTYLQLLFPNECEVEQLWHDKNSPYPTALISTKPSFSWWLHQVGEPGLKLDGTWGLGRPIVGADESRRNRRIDTSGMFLTSRIRISLDFSVHSRSLTSLMNIFRSVIPARLLPDFRFWLTLVLDVLITLKYGLTMDKRMSVSYPWCGRVITDNPARRWKLGRDGELVKLPQPFGTFKVGERRGGYTEWWLTSCRIKGRVDVRITGSAPAWRVETLPPDPIPEYSIPDPPARLDGSWTIFDPRKTAGNPSFRPVKIRDYQSAIRLPPKPARLTLSGLWKLGGRRNAVFEIEKL